MSTLKRKIFLTVVVLVLGTAASRVSSAGPIEIQSIQISPAEITAGRVPEVTCTVKANAVPASGGAVDITVIASLVLPNNIVKSWTWKNISMRAAEIRTFSLPKEYETRLAGMYKVDFNVYTKDMRPLHRLSRSFVVMDAMQPVVMEPKKQAPVAATAGTESPATGPHQLGIGAYGNAVNAAGGATLLVWSSNYVGLQGSYSVGNFTTTEGRLLVRFPLSSGISPYIGVGYMSVATERTVEVIGEKATFRDNGVSGAAGLEVPLSKNIVGYAEVSGANIDLKKEINNGVFLGTASVKYSPVSVGVSIVWYLF